MVGCGLISLKTRAKSTIQGESIAVYTARAGAAKKFQFGTPLVVVEGVKDAEVMSLAWPDTIACMTAHLSEPQAFALSMLTGHVILALDDDAAGRKGARTSRKYLEKYGVQVAHMGMPQGIKDPGMLLDGEHADRFVGNLGYFRSQLQTYGLVSS
jgi:DNA primase